MILYSIETAARDAYVSFLRRVVPQGAVLDRNLARKVPCGPLSPAAMRSCTLLTDVAVRSEAVSVPAEFGFSPTLAGQVVYLGCYRRPTGAGGAVLNVRLAAARALRLLPQYFTDETGGVYVQEPGYCCGVRIIPNDQLVQNCYRVAAVRMTAIQLNHLGWVNRIRSRQ